MKIPPEFISLDWKRIEQFYYASMLKGYASDAKPFPRSEPGWKELSVTEGNMRLVDAWHTTPGSDASSGVTMIYYWVHVPPKNAKTGFVPIWTMHYGGYYRRVVTPFLKSVLRASYREPLEFTGCRGICESIGNDYTYTNMVRTLTGGSMSKASFLSFSGQERILGPHSEMFGFHAYFGHSLV